MSSAYRSFARQKPTVALVVRAKRSVAMMAFLAFCGVFAMVPILFVRFVSVDCARAGAADGTCRVRDVGALDWRTHVMPLADLAAFRVDASQDSDGDELSRLVLVTNGGEIPLGVGDNIDTGGRRALAARFAEFKTGADPRFSMTTGFGSLGMGVVWALVCGAPLFVRRSVRVVIDPARGAIHVRRWFRTFHLPLSRETRIDHDLDSGGDTIYSLVGGGENVRLLQGVRPEDLNALDDALRAALPERHDA